ncbi:LuxR C-terminal-related transcriptional regulator [Micromonospora echinospora]|uniref:LuxR C-terminal-related transcriptional regulator n=1 Tax=Micromonospora echinospora TaxID=1877 RepID=UPI003CF1DFAC
MTLQALGLDGTAESVYRTMLAHDGWGVRQLAEHLATSETTVRTALDQLAEMALLRHGVDQQAGRPTPVSPEVALRALIRRQEADVRRHQQQLAESQAAMAQLLAEQALRQPAGPPVAMEHLPGVDAVRERLERLAYEAADECLAFMPGGPQSAESMSASAPLDADLLHRGVAVRTVYLDSLRNDVATSRYAHWLTEQGGEVRTVPTLPLRMVLFDRTRAIVPINPQDTRSGAVQVGGPGVMVALTSLFSQVWKEGTPLGTATARAVGSPPLTGQQHELLRLLAGGLTDEAVGKRLGLSLRTVRRMMAELMDRVGARSRFEAGAKAAQLGWVLKPEASQAR